MKDEEASRKLIKHVYKRVEEFLDECDPNDYGMVAELQRAFARFLRHKENPPMPPKEVDGVLAQHVLEEDAVDENSATLAFLKALPTGRIGLMWSPILFNNPALPLPDDVREMLVTILRFHADRLEDRSLDAQMQELTGKSMGTA